MTHVKIFSAPVTTIDTPSHMLRDCLGGLGASTFKRDARRITGEDVLLPLGVARLVDGVERWGVAREGAV